MKCLFLEAVEHYCISNSMFTTASLSLGSLLDKNSNILHLSSIFLWFTGNFESYGGVREFVSAHLPSDEAQYVTQHKPTLKYFPYNWDANGAPPCNC